MASENDRIDMAMASVATAHKSLTDARAVVFAALRDHSIGCHRVMKRAQCGGIDCDSGKMMLCEGCYVQCVNVVQQAVTVPTAGMAIAFVVKRCGLST